MKKSETIDIFNDGDDMEEVFSAKKLPPPKSNLIKKSLFDDDLDDEDDIFGSGPSSMAGNVGGLVDLGVTLKGKVGFSACEG